MLPHIVEIALPLGWLIGSARSTLRSAPASTRLLYALLLAAAAFFGLDYIVSGNWANLNDVMEWSLGWAARDVTRLLQSAADQ
ncbi:hypothetical protein IDH44_07265 [Paenibacillus sp. IB182496]|uniref:Uncharacterized protein n=1 Tax=Paenibacillus sabuli TaxID=2772509 RepID=A0A927BT02_9BACL|nr:hypothetical protein [Paenibacillus sabuli]MBD2844984.1 hypothetical protein [Paenibacillus sabuli]